MPRRCECVDFGVDGDDKRKRRSRRWGTANIIGTSKTTAVDEFVRL
jgi:hypothetical protein